MNLSSHIRRGRVNNPVHACSRIHGRCTPETKEDDLQDEGEDGPEEGEDHAAHRSEKQTITLVKQILWEDNTILWTSKIMSVCFCQVVFHWA